MYTYIATRCLNLVPYCKSNLVLFASTSGCCAGRPVTCTPGGNGAPPPSADSFPGLKTRARELKCRKYQVKARYRVSASALLYLS